MPYHLAIDPRAFSFYYILFCLSIIVKNLLNAYILNVIINNKGGLFMEEKENDNNMFISNGSLKQDEVNRIVTYLKECGMSDDDIDKIGNYKDWFHLNPLYEKKENETKGKEK